MSHQALFMIIGVQNEYIVASDAAEYIPTDHPLSHSSSGAENLPQDTGHEMQSTPMEVIILGQPENPTQILAMTSSETNHDGEIALLRRGNADAEWGENHRGIIRVHRPAGVKWNQPMQ